MRRERTLKTFQALVSQEKDFESSGGQLGVAARADDEKERYPKSIEKNAWKG